METGKGYFNQVINIMFDARIDMLDRNKSQIGTDPSTAVLCCDDARLSG
jgi:hypothetical protein